MTHGGVVVAPVASDFRPAVSVRSLSMYAESAVYRAFEIFWGMACSPTAHYHSMRSARVYMEEAVNELHTLLSVDAPRAAFVVDQIAHLLQERQMLLSAEVPAGPEIEYRAAIGRSFQQNMVAVVCAYHTMHPEH